MHSVHELHSRTDQGQEVTAVETAPALLGPVEQLEDHQRALAARAGAPRRALAQAHGGECDSITLWCAGASSVPRGSRRKSPGVPSGRSATRRAENPAVSEETIRELAGHVSRAMLAGYSHTRADAKRAAIASLDLNESCEVAQAKRR